MWRRDEVGGKRANLDGANLDGANLDGASLGRASLGRANLDGASLVGASLVGAIGITIPVSDPAKPYVRPTTPEEVKAARRARMLKYRERNPDVPVVDRLDAKILESVTGGGGRLEMSTWHSCTMTHCIGGWAIVHAGEAGAKLEAKYDSQRAATMIYRASTGRVPHFFASNERALEDIKACAAESDT